MSLHPNLFAHLIAIGHLLDSDEADKVPAQLDALMAECCRLQRSEDTKAFRTRRVPALIVEVL